MKTKIVDATFILTHISYVNEKMKNCMVTCSETENKAEIYDSIAPVVYRLFQLQIQIDKIIVNASNGFGTDENQPPFLSGTWCDISEDEKECIEQQLNKMEFYYSGIEKYLKELDVLKELKNLFKQIVNTVRCYINHTPYEEISITSGVSEIKEKDFLLSDKNLLKRWNGDSLLDFLEKTVEDINELFMKENDLYTLVNIDKINIVSDNICDAYIDTISYRLQGYRKLSNPKRMEEIRGFLIIFDKYYKEVDKSKIPSYRTITTFLEALIESI